MTLHVPRRRLRFFMTADAPCPYLPDRRERKVFAHLGMAEGAVTNDALAQSGFRRSQSIAYRPACEACEACVSTRIPVADYAFSRGERRTLNRNSTLTRHLVEAEATPEQYDLLRRYLKARHPGGGMSGMSWSDYVAMVEDTTVRTHVMEYREPSVDGGPGELAAAVLVDLMRDGLSLVYSFYRPDQERRSLGRFLILDHVRQAQAVQLRHVYLGYWVAGSPTMAYKARFAPLEALRPGGWTRIGDAERTAPAPPPAHRIEASPLRNALRVRFALDG